MFVYINVFPYSRARSLKPFHIVFFFIFAVYKIRDLEYEKENKLPNVSREYSMEAFEIIFWCIACFSLFFGFFFILNLFKVAKCHAKNKYMYSVQLERIYFSNLE